MKDFDGYFKINHPEFIEDGRSGNYKFNYRNDMTNLFTINWRDVKSALTNVFLSAVLGMGLYVLNVGSVFQIDFHSLVNIGAISVVTGIVSIIKHLLTTSEGNFVGLVSLK